MGAEYFPAPVNQATAPGLMLQFEQERIDPKGARLDFMSASTASVK
jgi:hypothetical protein